MASAYIVELKKRSRKIFLHSSLYICDYLTINNLIHKKNNKNKLKKYKYLNNSTLNKIIHQNLIIAMVVCNKFDQVRIPDDIQKEFFGSDKKFIQDQIKNSSNAKMDTDRLYF